MKIRQSRNRTERDRRRKSLVRPKKCEGTAPEGTGVWGEIAILSLSQIEEAACLQPLYGKVDNGAMRAGTRFTVCAVAIACVCLSGPAQCQDRDSTGAPKTSKDAPPPEARIDINHATEDQLLKVPGMTRSWAERIIRFRPYRVKGDLMEMGVVPDDFYDRIKDFVIAHHEKQ